jgi:6-phosphogluconolactonase
MSQNEKKDQPFSPNPITRRGFLAGATAAATVAHASIAGATGLAGHSSSSRRFAYLGTYTGAVGNGGNGQGIYLYEANPWSGELRLIKLAAATPSPSYLAASPSGDFLYAVNEVSNFNGTNGSVSAFAVNRQTGDLTFLNTVSSLGSGPAFLSLDATGKFVFVANYGAGSLAVIAVNRDGSLGAAVDSHLDTGSVGPTTATNAPPGSFAFSGHDAPHVHCAIADPKNKFVLQTDLGQDRIYVYKFNASTGKLTPAATPYIAIPPGDGPRHLAFHPNGRWLYSIQEEASTLMLFNYDESTGALSEQQIISCLPPGFAGSSFGSELEVSADGRFVYAANRLHDSIAVFAVGFRGELTYAGEAATRGDYPAQFTIDPTGSFLYSCNQHGDDVTSFRIHPETGVPTFIGQYIAAGTPGCIIFLP